MTIGLNNARRCPCAANSLQPTSTKFNSYFSNLLLFLCLLDRLTTDTSSTSRFVNLGRHGSLLAVKTPPASLGICFLCVWSPHSVSIIKKMEYLQRQNGTYNDRPIESRIWSIGAIFNDLNLDVKVMELLYMLSVLCAQLTRDLFAIASFLVLH